jgi:hypothetical protein
VAEKTAVRAKGGRVKPKSTISLRRAAGICLVLVVLAASAARGNASPVLDGPGAGLPPLLPPSIGLIYYVSTTGNDSNDGTFDLPWRTVQHALDTLLPGETALVRGGNYSENLYMSRDGAPSAPITVAGYQRERPVLRPAGGAENTYPIQIGSASYFRLHGFVIEDATGFSSTDVYFERGAHHVELSGNEIRNSADQGIFSDDTTHDLQIVGNAIHDNGPSPIHQSHGIYLEGVDHLVANNVVYDNHFGYGIHVYPSADHVLIVHNTVVGNGNPLTGGGIILGGNSETTVDNTKIVNNIVAFNASMGVRSYFPLGTVRPVGNQAFSNVGFANVGGDFSTFEGGGIDFSMGNIVADPLFVDLAGLDFRLDTASPAINRALAYFSPAVDFDRVSRPRGLMPDIGAFESY